MKAAGITKAIREHYPESPASQPSLYLQRMDRRLISDAHYRVNTPREGKGGHASRPLPLRAFRFSLSANCVIRYMRYIARSLSSNVENITYCERYTAELYLDKRKL